MALTTTSTLPANMRERTFALVNSATNEVFRFGRGTDYHCSEYRFPSMGITGDTYRTNSSHASIFGPQGIEGDYFEAEFGCIDPHAAAKISEIQAAWARASYSRPSLGSHWLYYILGGRARMLYGMPGDIAPKHLGFKSTFHTGVLRYNVVDAFSYGADLLNLKEVIPTTTTDKFYTFDIQRSVGDLPTPASISIKGVNTKPVTVDVSPNSDGPWRPLLHIYNIDGTFSLYNSPGGSLPRYVPNTGTISSGSDLIKPTTPSFRDVKIWPADQYIRLGKGINTGNLEIEVEWRQCYAGS